MTFSLILNWNPKLAPWILSYCFHVCVSEQHANLDGEVARTRRLVILFYDFFFFFGPADTSYQMHAKALAKAHLAHLPTWKLICHLDVVWIYFPWNISRHANFSSLALEVNTKRY